MLHTNNPVIKHKAGLLNLAEELGNVSKACKVMGVSRDTFYRYRELAEQGGVDALINRSRRGPNLKNRTDAATEQAVIDYAVEFPAHGQHRTSNELRKKGIFISGSGVRSVWVRHSLENFKKRLKALEEKVAKEGIALTDAQIAALERKAHDDEASGEIETAHPGYLGSQDTFYVGNLKGVGRIYQQTFVDTYSKVAHCKLYVSKTPITAADLLNDRVLPFYESQGLPMLRILTDRGTEYCGRVEHHDYQLYLALSDIDHTKTKAMSPQTNGICERFHKTILQEFYQVTFRKKLYVDLDTLQSDLDEWLEYYNNARTHQGKMCCGRTPMETLVDGKRIWAEKNLSQM
ncbi:IS481 family transposase [Pectobacterium brasiliense]|uniref:IS481 family transposase n=3 Tax=Pectobacterium brasiliense TaxID=180957 RepID=UPI00057E6BA1|nr:IS481 family transposase [Pectobacterium brasiliense]KHT38968.1 integrase [Pectobacterium brasiliense]MBN3114525.1 IS481 family transposase [Pectobacterium brasiliense]WGL28916.1 IS481 family transposase [Pectobacterium brasiliense]WGL29344.1 IS481 family transposase [Pectobacterium brasiliense]WJM81149.1 IS481 family transposase [Pectobacterium brasiliense]